MKHLLTILAAVLTFNTALFAQFGTLDNTFSGDGFLSMQVGLSHATCYDIALQPDGKILLCGSAKNPSNNTDMVIIRLNSDGTFDNSFGTNGTKLMDNNSQSNSGFAMAVLPNGKLIVVGQTNTTVSNSDLYITRLNSDGSVDASFGTNGVTITDVSGQKSDRLMDVAVQPDGKIVASGDHDSYSLVVRYTADGHIDTSFSTDGFVTATGYRFVNDIALQDDGKIVAVGHIFDDVIDSTNISIVRYNADGSYDTAFDGDGILEISLSPNYDGLNRVLILPGNQILACGFAGSKAVLLRINSNGTFDNTFGNAGIVISQISTDNTHNNFFYELGRQSDGNIVAVGGYGPGYGNKIMEARYNADGVFETSNIDPEIDNAFMNCWAMVIQPDDKIVVTGGTYDDNFQLLVVVKRYIAALSTGIIDFAVTKQTTLIYPNPIADVETLQYTLAAAENITISLIDNQGKLVKTFVENVNQPAGNYKQELVMPNLAQGIYYLNISSPNGEVSIRVVK